MWPVNEFPKIGPSTSLEGRSGLNGTIAKETTAYSVLGD
jgi:hypothetical protein